jgi:predicted ester cyclase
MSTEQNKTITRQIFTALNDRDLNGVIAHYAPGCRFHGWGPESVDVNGYVGAMSAILNAFPDSRFPMEDVVAEGDRVVVRHSLRGTHQAEFQGVPTTDRPVVVNAIVILRYENGKAAELWLNADFLGLMQQLGAIPQ